MTAKLCSSLALVLLASHPGSLTAQGLGCPCNFIGVPPLTDFASGQLYHGFDGSPVGFEGGLYPGNRNDRPPDHEAAGLEIARRGILPLDSNGNVDLNQGKIVLASLGMSNTNQEFDPFIDLAAADPEVRSNFVAVQGAQGGQTADIWADPGALAWDRFDAAIGAAGVQPAQLQVVWMKLAVPANNLSEGFPAAAQKFTGWLKDTVRNLKAKYPAVKLVLCSSRTYGGYALTPLNPEPFAFESGYAMKWLIEAQIVGDPELAYDGPGAPAPWLCWGPYLWADGLGADGVAGGVPGRSDGLEWFGDDFRSDDRTHPSVPQGVTKVGHLLLDWLKQDLVAAPWFLEESIGARAGLRPGAGQPADGTAVPGALGVTLAQIEIETDAASEPSEWSSVTLSVLGQNEPAVDLTGIRLFRDTNGDGAVDPGDSLLASADRVDRASFSLTLDQPLRLAPGGVTALLVAADLADPLHVPDATARLLPGTSGGRTSPGSPIPWLLGALLLTIAFHKRSAVRWRLAPAGAVLLVVAVACARGGGSGSSGSAPPTLVTSTFSVQVEDFEVIGVPSGRPAQLSGLPVLGRVVSVDH